MGYDFTDASLAATDAQWGVPGVNYGVGRRRMEIPPEGTNDTVTFSGSTVSLSMFASFEFVDQIRIYICDFKGSACGAGMLFLFRLDFVALVCSFELFVLFLFDDLRGEVIDPARHCECGRELCGATVYQLKVVRRCGTMAW